MRREDEMNAELSPGERELEAAMGSLKPVTPAGVDRDRMLFAAGAASARQSLHVWRAAAAVLVVGLGVSLFVRGSNEPRIVREVVYVNPPAPSAPLRQTQPTERPSPAIRADLSNALLLSTNNDLNYLSLRERALRWGVSAALPETSGQPVRRTSRRATRDRIDTTSPGDKL